MSVGAENMPDYIEADRHLRTMHYGDLQQVFAIEQQAYNHSWTIAIFRDCIRTGYNCWVYMNDKEDIVGYGIIMLAAGEAHILNLCVHPDYQKQGIGRKILRHLLHVAARSDIEMVLLEVRESNKIAIELYLSENFNELGVRTNYYPADNGREDAIILAKHLIKQQ